MQLAMLIDRAQGGGRPGRDFTVPPLEAPVLATLHHEVMPGMGLTFAGHHHEIYLSDPRRVAPEKLKTILRQPVRPV